MTVNNFLRMHPEHKHRKLSIDGNGNIITGGGAVLAVPDGSGGWITKNIGGRPTQDRLSHDLRVRVSESQYQKLQGYADAHGKSKPEVIREMIDEL